jgi:hypothetical protein
MASRSMSCAVAAMSIDEVDVGPDGSELQFLVEALVQTRGFDIVEDERHGDCLQTLEPELESGETHPEPLCEADEIVIIRQIPR